MRTLPTSIAEPTGELRKNSELARLRTENRDLRIALQTSNDHGDLLQEHLYRLSAKLKAEVDERQMAEQKLHQMLQAATSEKVDLEILVQILIDQGDQSAEEGGKARIDALTQIANRRRFDEFLSQEWSKHFRVRQPLALLMCDVDHFKLYNDYYGHQAGDECLKSVANAIASCQRAQDLVARCGGEEFAVVLPNAGRQAAGATAVRVRAAVAARVDPACEIPDRRLRLIKHWRSRQNAADSRSGRPARVPGRSGSTSLPGQASRPEPHRRSEKRRFPDS